MSVLKLSLVLLYSFKQLFSHQSSFPHIAISFFLFCVTELIHDAEYSGAVDVLCKTFR